MFTRDQIVNGVVKFIETDMQTAAGNGTSKFIVSLTKNALKKHPAIVDEALKNPLIHTILPSEDGKYDITQMIALLKDTMAETGTLPLKLPRIPLLLPEGDEIRLNTADIDKIVSYINENKQAEAPAQTTTEA